MPDRHPDMGSAELEVLNILWDHGASTVRQVLEHLHANGRRLAYTTVLTYLSRLEQKGLVQSNKKDIAYVYRPAVSRERVRRSRLKAMLSQLYDGAAGALVLQLIKTQKFTPQEIEELQELITRLEGKAK